MSEETNEPAAIPDEKIEDRAAYERECLLVLMKTAERYTDWTARGFELIDAQLHGSFPGTYITVRLRVPGQEAVLEDTWPLWSGEGALTHDSQGLAYRFSPHFLIDLYLGALLHP